jgi:hypothetical protein
MFFLRLSCLLLTALAFNAHAAETHTNHSAVTHMPGGHAMHGKAPLESPGNEVFGAIREVIEKLEADPDTNWSQVDLEGLRRHLVDMLNFTVNVDVPLQRPIEKGFEAVVKPTTPEARQSLKRVFAAHPPQLKVETGWAMGIVEKDGSFIITVTTEKPSEVAKVRGLGYIGVMAIGSHHVHHHWMLATGQHPHGKEH